MIQKTNFHYQKAVFVRLTDTRIKIEKKSTARFFEEKLEIQLSLISYKTLRFSGTKL